MIQSSSAQISPEMRTLTAIPIAGAKSLSRRSSQTGEDTVPPRRSGIRAGLTVAMRPGLRRSDNERGVRRQWRVPANQPRRQILAAAFRAAPTKVVFSMWDDEADLTRSIDETISSQASSPQGSCGRMETFDKPSKTCWVPALLFIVSLCPAHRKRRLLGTGRIFEVQKWMWDD